MDKEKIKEISEQIQELIEDEVAKQNTNQECKDRIESFINTFDYMIEEARETLEDFRSQGLSLNTIESEGYLRAFLTIQSILPTID
jgi:hypothetical protein